MDALRSIGQGSEVAPPFLRRWSDRVSGHKWPQIGNLKQGHLLAGPVSENTAGLFCGWKT
jgi:hypothetical protein